MNKLKIYLINVLTFSNVLFGMNKSGKSQDDGNTTHIPVTILNNDEKKGFFAKNWPRFIIPILIGLIVPFFLSNKKKDDVIDEKTHNKP
jgi:hypothetical protein